MRNLPQTKAAQSEMGKKYGRKNVESGQIERIRNLPQSAAARVRVGLRHVESGHLRSIASIGGKASGRMAAESGRLERMRNLPQTKEAQRRIGRRNVENGQLARIGPIGRKSKHTPSKEEVSRLHKPLGDSWKFNVHVDPGDGGNEIEVDAVLGKVCAFYDGTWWHSTEKARSQDRKQRDRLERAGYTVRSVFGRAPTKEEVAQWVAESE